MRDIRIIPVDGETRLHHTYPGQAEPQPCYIELVPESDPPTVLAEWDPEIGGAVPIEVYHGLVRRYGICPMLDTEAMALMEELLPLFGRVVEGYKREWDGNNHVGRLSEDAQAAEREIECRIMDLPDSELRVFDAGDWLSGVDVAQDQGITADTTDEEIEAAATRIEDDAYSQGIQEITGVEDYLARLRARLREGEDA